MMQDNDDYDPLRKSRLEASSFNLAWLKDGQRMTWTQRLGFSVFSFVFLSAGFLFGTYAVSGLLQGEPLGAAGWLVPTIIFVVPGALGLRNVLRF